MAAGGSICYVCQAARNLPREPIREMEDEKVVLRHPAPELQLKFPHLMLSRPFQQTHTPTRCTEGVLLYNSVPLSIKILRGFIFLFSSQFPLQLSGQV